MELKEKNESRVEREHPVIRACPSSPKQPDLSSQSQSSLPGVNKPSMTGLVIFVLALRKKEASRAWPDQDLLR